MVLTFLPNFYDIGASLDTYLVFEVSLKGEITNRPLGPVITHNLITIHLLTTYIYRVYCKYHTKMMMKKIYFNDCKQDMEVCWLASPIKSMNPWTKDNHPCSSTPWFCNDT